MSDESRADLSAVDRLFARLLLRYGSAWTAKWAGIPIEAVKADWEQALAGRAGWAVKFAIENLPESPPNVAQFVKLCRDAPAPHVALPLGKVESTPSVREEALAKLATFSFGSDGRAWIPPLQERRAAMLAGSGPNLPAATLAMLAAAERSSAAGEPSSDERDFSDLKRQARDRAEAYAAEKGLAL